MEKPFFLCNDFGEISGSCPLHTCTACYGILSSSTVLAGADLIGLGIQVPQVLVPQHPAIIDGVAVGPVIVAIGWVFAMRVLVTVVSLKLQGFDRVRCSRLRDCLTTRVINGNLLRKCAYVIK